jgi:hypothetical protein
VKKQANKPPTPFVLAASLTRKRGWDWDAAYCGACAYLRCVPLQEIYVAAGHMSRVKHYVEIDDEMHAAIVKSYERSKGIFSKTENHK